MGKIYKSVIAAVVGIILTTGSAMAFQGFSIGVFSSDSTFKTKGSEYEAGVSVGTDEINSTTISQDVDYGAIFAEITTGTAGGFGMTFGIEYTPGKAKIGAKTRADTSTNDGADDDDGTYSAEAKVEHLSSIYFEPSFMVNDYFGLYLKGGVTTANVLTLESIAFGDDSSDYPNEWIVGKMVGVGAKAVSPWGIFIKVEATQIDFEQFSLTSATGNKNRIEADPEEEAVRVALGFNF